MFGVVLLLRLLGVVETPHTEKEAECIRARCLDPLIVTTKTMAFQPSITLHPWERRREKRKCKTKSTEKMG